MADEVLYLWQYLVGRTERAMYSALPFLMVEELTPKSPLTASLSIYGLRGNVEVAYVPMTIYQHSHAFLDHSVIVRPNESVLIRLKVGIMNLEK